MGVTKHQLHSILHDLDLKPVTCSDLYITGYMRHGRYYQSYIFQGDVENTKKTQFKFQMPEACLLKIT